MSGVIFLRIWRGSSPQSMVQNPQSSQCSVFAERVDPGCARIIIMIMIMQRRKQEA